MEGDYSLDQTLDVADIDALSRAIRSGLNEPYFDLNEDEIVDTRDHAVWIEDLKRVFRGDANLDSKFDNEDLVSVFTAGEYEDDIQYNSGWAEGDWDADGDFTSGDLIVALQDGGYERGARGPVAAVPEPSAVFLAALAVIGLSIVPGTRRKPV